MVVLADFAPDSAELASVRYEQLVNDATAGKHDQALSQAEALAGEFPDSAYASLASLIAARAAVETNVPDKAKQHLEWVVEHAPFPELVTIARLRLTRLMLDAREYDDALDELDGIDSAPFHGRVTELPELSQSTRVRVQMKLDDLGEFTSPPSS